MSFGFWRAGKPGGQKATNHPPRFSYIQKSGFRPNVQLGWVYSTVPLRVLYLPHPCFIIMTTVDCIIESTKPHLCSKFPFFKTSWWMFRVLPQLSPLYSSLPYLRAFKWVTVWPCTLRGIKYNIQQVKVESSIFVK